MAKNPINHMKSANTSIYESSNFMSQRLFIKSLRKFIEENYNLTQSHAFMQMLLLLRDYYYHRVVKEAYEKANLVFFERVLKGDIPVGPLSLVDKNMPTLNELPYLIEDILERENSRYYEAVLSGRPLIQDHQIKGYTWLYNEMTSFIKFRKDIK
ncbi:MAG TPA: hypothetical protein VI815_02480 [Candidatus Nanoarchaeia archaeon]|nr:hypothetical protein [Candidatus Nanoarchaeia archaeon]